MRGGDGAQGGRGIGGSEEASMAMGTEGDEACKAASGRKDGGLRSDGHPRTSDPRIHAR